MPVNKSGDVLLNNDWCNETMYKRSAPPIFTKYTPTSIVIDCRFPYHVFKIETKRFTYSSMEPIDTRKAIKYLKTTK